MTFAAIKFLTLNSALSSLLIGLALLLFALLIVVVWLMQRTRQSSAMQTHAAKLLVVYASQTGTAEQLAKQTYQQLQVDGDSSLLVDIHHLSVDMLEQAQTVLWVVSTTGDGEAPDAAHAFVRKLMRTPLEMHQLRYAILALGDRSYRHFCGFGYTLDEWLAASGAIALFDLVAMDHHAPVAYQTWLDALGQWLDLNAANAVDTQQYQPCVLRERILLNPQNKAFPAYHIRFDNTAQFNWQAGDIVSVQCQNSPQVVSHFLQKYGLDGANLTRVDNVSMPLQQALSILAFDHKPLELQAMQQWITTLVRLPSREYSIASTPKQKSIDLVVRQRRATDGQLGLGSGWLTEYASMGQSVQLTIRGNHNFHGPDESVPMILIGSGTGIAGLMAHLFEREQLKAHDNWLIWGERYRSQDHFFAQQIDAWQASKHLERCDVMFSRDIFSHDGQALRYVQDCLMANPVELTAWISRGAAIYVCGSAEGMAQAVDEALRQVLGADTVDALMDAQRYQRDVY